MLMRGIPHQVNNAPSLPMPLVRADSTKPLEKIVDPFGDPVKAAFDLYAGADALGRSMASSPPTCLLLGTVSTSPPQRACSRSDERDNWQAMVDAAAKVDWQTLMPTCRNLLMPPCVPAASAAVITGTLYLGQDRRRVEARSQNALSSLRTLNTPNITAVYC